MKKEKIRTKTGEVLTDEEIEALADEAEKGYAIGHLLNRENKLNQLQELELTLERLHQAVRSADTAREQVWRLDLDEVRKIPLNHSITMQRGCTLLAIRRIRRVIRVMKEDQNQ